MLGHKGNYLRIKMEIFVINFDRISDSDIKLCKCLLEGRKSLVT